MESLIKSHTKWPCIHIPYPGISDNDPPNSRGVCHQETGPGVSGRAVIHRSTGTSISQHLQVRLAQGTHLGVGHVSSLQCGSRCSLPTLGGRLPANEENHSLAPVDTG